MPIAFTSLFENGTRAIAQAATELAEAQRQLSSGRRIASPSADPVGTAGAISEHATLDRLDAHSGATNAAGYRLGLADTVLSDVIGQLTAAQTTALSARGSTQTQAHRNAAANELLAIRDTLLSDANTEFLGTYLFSGSNVTQAPFVRTGSTISAYLGDAAPTSIDIGEGRTASTTFDGGRIFQGGDSQHVLDALTDLASAVTAGNDTGIAAGVDALVRASDRANAAQQQVGSQLRLIEDQKLDLAAARTSAAGRLSALEDTDLVAASSRLVQAETAYRAALGAMATVGRTSLMDYLK